MSKSNGNQAVDWWCGVISCLGSTGLNGVWFYGSLLVDPWLALGPVHESIYKTSLVHLFNLFAITSNHNHFAYTKTRADWSLDSIYTHVLYMTRGGHGCLLNNADPLSYPNSGRFSMACFGVNREKRLIKWSLKELANCLKVRRWMEEVGSTPTIIRKLCHFKHLKWFVAWLNLGQPPTDHCLSIKGQS